MYFTEFKKVLYNAGIKKGFFGKKAVRLFDKDFYVPESVEQIDKKVRTIIANLAAEGINFTDDYAENGNDCDNAAIIIWAEMMKLWIKKNKGKKSFPAYAFGFAHIPGHALNIGVCKDGVHVWDYGRLIKDFDLTTIDEVNFA